MTTFFKKLKSKPDRNYKRMTFSLWTLWYLCSITNKRANNCLYYVKHNTKLLHLSRKQAYHTQKKNMNTF